jgi:hypothetical protein
MALTALQSPLEHLLELMSGSTSTSRSPHLTINAIANIGQHRCDQLHIGIF